MLTKTLPRNSPLRTATKAALIINALKQTNGSRVTSDHLKSLLYKTYGSRCALLFRDLPDVLEWCIKFDILRKSRSNYIVYDETRPTTKGWVGTFRFISDVEELTKMQEAEGKVREAESRNRESEAREDGQVKVQQAEVSGILEDR